MDFILKRVNYTITEEVSDGARKKFWVKSEDNSRYLLKFNKHFSDGECTCENLAELLSMVIGRKIGIQIVDIIAEDDWVLSKVMSDKMLQSFIEFSDELSHSFHMSNLTTYNISTLLSNKNRYKTDVIRMLLFDALIGNSDRHPGNFMYSEDGFYPLFDNGSALCSYVEENKIRDILKDKNRFLAMCTTKSKPVVRDDQKITHEELIHILETQFPDEVLQFSKGVTERLDVVSVLDETRRMLGFSDERYQLLYRFLEYRKSWFVRIVQQNRAFQRGREQ